MIYLASPYTHDDRAVEQQRYEAARAATAHLLNQGRLVISPIVHSHPVAEAHNLPDDFRFWRRQSIDLLERCDELWVLMLGGWRESEGVRAEIEHACNLDMPVHHMRPSLKYV